MTGLERRRRRARPGVVDACELLDEALLLGEHALGLPVEVLVRVLEPLLRRGDRLQAEDGQQRVVQLGRPAEQHRAELGVGEERPEGPQGIGPVEPGERLALVPLPLAPAGRHVHVVALPLPVTVVTPGSPSTTSSTATAGTASTCRLRQPCFHTFTRPVQRAFVPVRATSAASAKLDLPDPLRPTTKVSPGPACSRSAAGGPMPRNPSTCTVLR